MKFITIAATFLALLAVTSAGVINWEGINDKVDEANGFSFRVALKPQNLTTLEALFWDISNPSSPFFGQFLTNQDITDLISLPEDDIATVEEYLKSTPEDHCQVEVTRSLHSDYLLVETCAGQAQLLFPNLKLQVYQRGDRKILRSASLVDITDNFYLLGVPSHLHQYIESIDQVTDLPIMGTRAADYMNTSLPWLPSDKVLSIEDLVSHYGMSYSDIETASLNADSAQVRAGIVEFDGNKFSVTGLKAYQNWEEYPVDPVQKVIGTEEVVEESVEARIDVELITAIGQKVQVWDFLFGDELDYVKVADKIMGTSGAPNVISISYGEPESYYGTSKIPANNTAFMKLGLAGFTILVSGGDSGPILDVDDCYVLGAEFPAGSPYVTAVGGTKIDKTTEAEGAWFHSSGGFSRLNTRPAYQDAHVEHWMGQPGLLANKNNQKYLTANRAYPDVSAIAAVFWTWAPGQLSTQSGTSGSSPQFAGMIALINTLRYQNGLGPLGAINQTLYASSQGVGYDVQEGQSYSTSRYSCTFTEPGFKAVDGWDPVTGLGSPRWETLVEVLGSVQGSSSVTKRQFKKD